MFETIELHQNFTNCMLRQKCRDIHLDLSVLKQQTCNTKFGDNHTITYGRMVCQLCK